MTSNQFKSVVIPAWEDPVLTCKMLWPHYTLYDKQKEIAYSLRDNFETIVPAGNDMGKDFITGMLSLWFFISRTPARVLTTSVDGSQLNRVLWGEIRRFKDESVIPLNIQYTHMLIHQITNSGQRIPRSELEGRVVQAGEGLLGRHADRTAKGEPTTLLVIDEASGVSNETYEKADTWAHRILIIGNPYHCRNFFYRGTKEGDAPSTRPAANFEKLHRKVIRIRGDDSPNVKQGLYEESKGLTPSYKDVVPGVLSYGEYQRRIARWDEQRQTIGLCGEFYEGAETSLYPISWIQSAQRDYVLRKDELGQRRALAIGVDPAEGGDSTTFAAVDEFGLIDLVSMKTPDTSEVLTQILAFMRKVGMNPDNRRDCSYVCLDRGGGGKQHADYGRKQGHRFRTVAFGAGVTQEPKYGMTVVPDRKELVEARMAYKNRRAEMAGRLMKRLDPSEPSTFLMPPESTGEQYERLYHQLSCIPKQYDNEGGKLVLPSKRKKSKDSKEDSLVDLIGYSPDEWDAVMLAVYSMEVKPELMSAGSGRKRTATAR